MKPTASTFAGSTQVAPGAVTALLGQLAHYDDGAASPAPVAPGSRVGRFEVLREIGRGGFGVVYEARDPLLGRNVALKLLRPSRLRQALGARGLVEEAEAAAQLQHPNVVAIYELGEHDGTPYLVLELLSGETLEERLRRGALPADEALAIATQVTRAVAHAHARGLVHRDLKPGNVFVCGDGAVKVLDFGLSVFAGTADAPSPKDGGGTPAYMSPERIRGERGDARGDVFAIGVMLHEMLGGERPRALDGRRTKRPRLGPRALRAIVSSALEARPEARPRDCGALLDALTKATARQAAWRHRRWWAAGVVTLTLAIAGGLAWRAEMAPPSKPIPIAVADATNTSGAPELDAISTLLATALEPSHRLRGITRAEVVHSVRSASGAELPRVDLESLRAHRGEVGVRVALLPSARRDGAAYVVGVRAVELEHDRVRFALEERSPDLDGVMPALDRIALAVRRRLREPEAELEASRFRLADATTRSIAAYASYQEGLQCAERSGAPEVGCVALIEKATELDPGFALAHAEIAMRTLWMGKPLEDVQAVMARALRHADRLPPAGRLKLMAFAADLEDRESDAAVLYQQAAAASPGDRLLLSRAADFFLTRNEPDLALPFWARVHELEIVPREQAMYLALTLGALRRRDDLAALARELESTAPTASSLIALGFARSMLGDTPGAIAAARAAISSSVGEADRQEATRWHTHFRLRSGDLTVEPELRAACMRRQLRQLLALGGRWREALALLDHPLPQCPAPDQKELDRDFGDASMTARLIATAGVPDRMWSYARRSAELNPPLGADLAAFLAYAGDLEHARTLAARYYPGSQRQQIYEAIVLWRTGDREAARARLRALYERNPWTAPPPTLPASFLYGELLAELGDDAGAVEALRTFQVLDHPIDDFWMWAYPKSLYLTARSEERLGRTADARASIEKLLALWQRADPDLPLLREAKALHARVTAQGL